MARHNTLITLVVLCEDDVLTEVSSGNLLTSAVATNEEELDVALCARRMVERIGGCVVFQYRPIPPIRHLVNLDDNQDTPVFLTELSQEELEECNAFTGERYEPVSLDEMVWRGGDIRFILEAAQAHRQ